MRRIGICFLLCLCAGGAFAYTESVAAISYNPSRLGAYQYLKAVQTATLRGGLQVEENASMNVSAAGSVLLRETESANECTSTQCSNDSSSGNINQITTIVPATGDNVTTRVDSSAIVQKISTPIENYQYNGTSQPNAVQGTDVTMYGGSLQAKQDSFINTLTATADKLNIEATASIQINGNAEAADTLQLGKITLIPDNANSLTWKDKDGKQVLGYQ